MAKIDLSIPERPWYKPPRSRQSAPFFMSEEEARSAHQNVVDPPVDQQTTEQTQTPPVTSEPNPRGNGPIDLTGPPFPVPPGGVTSRIVPVSNIPIYTFTPEEAAHIRELRMQGTIIEARLNGAIGLALARGGKHVGSREVKISDDSTQIIQIVPAEQP